MGRAIVVASTQQHCGGRRPKRRPPQPGSTKDYFVFEGAERPFKGERIYLGFPVAVWRGYCAIGMAKHANVLAGRLLLQYP